VPILPRCRVCGAALVLFGGERYCPNCDAYEPTPPQPEAAEPPAPALNLACSCVGGPPAPALGVEYDCRGRRVRKGPALFGGLPGESAVVARVRALRAGVLTLRRVADVLNAEKAPARTEAPWSKTTVKTVLDRAGGR
jgi:hypothetical protein